MHSAIGEQVSPVCTRAKNQEIYCMQILKGQLLHSLVRKMLYSIYHGFGFSAINTGCAAWVPILKVEETGETGENHLYMVSVKNLNAETKERSQTLNRHWLQAYTCPPLIC